MSPWVAFDAVVAREEAEREALRSWPRRSHDHGADVRAAPTIRPGRAAVLRARSPSVSGGPSGSDVDDLVGRLAKVVHQRLGHAHVSVTLSLSPTSCRDTTASRLHVLAAAIDGKTVTTM